jgi:PAS domain S-box-containing protein
MRRAQVGERRRRGGSAEASGHSGSSLRRAPLVSDEPRLRHVAASSLQLADPRERASLLAPLLSDPVKAVWPDAVAAVAGAPRELLKPFQREAFDFSSAGLNLGNLYANLGDPARAGRYYRLALDVDDLFYPAKMNLAVLLSAQGRNRELKPPGPGGMVRCGTVTSPKEELKALIEVLADPTTLVVDNSGAVRQVNACAEALLGWSRDDLVGQPVEVLVPRGLREAHVRHRGTYASAPESRSMGPGRELRAAVRREIAVDVSLSPSERHGERLVVCVLRDASEMRGRLARMQQILDAMPGIFYIFDAEGRLRHWKRNVETLIGYSAEELRREAHPRLHPPGRP